MYQFVILLPVQRGLRIAFLRSAFGLAPSTAGGQNPTSDQQQAIVNFETQLSVAQAIDSVAGSLQADGATGGPSVIANQQFSIGVNDPIRTFLRLLARG